jgi:transcriptional regulator with XRE-family HTH domain
MAHAMHPTEGPETFHLITARNIRSVLSLQGIHAKDVAAAIGMSEAMFSQRMSGSSRWLAREIKALATELHVSTDVLLAEDEQAFKRSLSASGYKADSPTLDIITARDPFQQVLRFAEPLVAV